MTSNRGRIRRDLWRVTFIQLFTNPRTGLSNVRFLVGMWIGGFSSATRDKRA